ncbi:MAG: hypothetical protein IV084_07005 [Rugosibacter sp.]|nr:hypothetical protein [Rugosibacter sp.]
MLNGALFAMIEEAAAAVMILTEEVTQQELLASRLTRAEVLRQLRTMADTMDMVPAETRSQMPELEWDGWNTTAHVLNATNPKTGELDDALWFAARSLVPATLMWLRVYRQNQPELFTFQA